MAYIQKTKLGDINKYNFHAGCDRIDLFVSEGKPRMKIGDMVLDNDDQEMLLEELVLGMKEEPDSVKSVCNEILNAYGIDTLTIASPSISLSEEGNGYTRVRHYMNTSQGKDVVSKKQFGGKGFPFDQGKLFLESANSKVLSMQEFRKKYAITHHNKGSVYFEFLVNDDEVNYHMNPRTGLNELVVNPNSSEGGHPVYDIKSDIDFFKNS